MIILDAVEEFITTFRRELSTDSGGGNSLMDHLFAILLRLMQSNQSTSLYCCLYPTLCAFVHKFSKLLFYSPTPYGMHYMNVSPSLLAYHSPSLLTVGDLCPVVLQHCNSGVYQIRNHAATFLFLLMKVSSLLLPPPPNPQYLRWLFAEKL